MVLQTILEKMVKESVKNILTFSAEGIGRVTFSDIADNTKKEMNALGVKILSVIIEQVEQVFNQSRDKHRIVIRNKNKMRRLLTEMGEVEIKHTLYCDKVAGRYFFPADEILKIEKRARIENGLKAKLISDATITSYGKAATLANNGVSRQTVFNLVKRLNNFSAPIVKPNSKVEEIFIEADEDHIHLNTGKPADVKLVYVHEGRTIEKGRTKLINPRYFVSASGSKDLWNDVDDYLCSFYRPYHSIIHLSGDGATWIRQGVALYPNVRYHLDKFHVQRALTALSAGKKGLFRDLYFAVYNGDEHLFHSVKAQYDIIGKEANREALYLSDNIDFIDRDSSCCAESHVSHVLSARMSSRPMGWSISGADRIGKLRAYMFNKGEFRALIDMQMSESKQTPKSKERDYNSSIRKNGSSSQVMQCGIVEFRPTYTAYAKLIKSIIKEF